MSFKEFYDNTHNHEEPLTVEKMQKAIDRLNQMVVIRYIAASYTTITKIRYMIMEHGPIQLPITNVPDFYFGVDLREDQTLDEDIIKIVWSDGTEQLRKLQFRDGLQDTTTF